jgi:hypothetical protein
VKNNDPVHEPTARRNGSPGTANVVKTRATGPKVPDASREAKRTAATILEVLAGAASPTTAATMLDISLPSYYMIERRAIEALVVACEPKARGRAACPSAELEVLRKQMQRLERECTRNQTLLRLAQRTVGLVAPAAPHAKSKGTAKAKRLRRPTARALVVARTLRHADSGEATANEPAHDTPQQSMRQAAIPPGGS